LGLALFFRKFVHSSLQSLLQFPNPLRYWATFSNGIGSLGDTCAACRYSCRPAMLSLKIRLRYSLSNHYRKIMIAAAPAIILNMKFIR
jgi:hypothetical protein